MLDALQKFIFSFGRGIGAVVGTVAQMPVAESALQAAVNHVEKHGDDIGGLEGELIHLGAEIGLQAAHDALRKGSPIVTEEHVHAAIQKATGGDLPGTLADLQIPNKPVAVVVEKIAPESASGGTSAGGVQEFSTVPEAIQGDTQLITEPIVREEGGASELETR